MTRGRGKQLVLEDEGEDEYLSEDLGESDIDEELNLPKPLQSISFDEKKKLLKFKRDHNEREWDEEIFNRIGALERKIDYERLRKMTGTEAKKSVSSGESENEKEALPSDDDDDGLLADDGNSDNASEDEDLFDSDEEAEISKRPTKKASDVLEGNEHSKSSKILGKKRKRAANENFRRSTRLQTKQWSEEEDDDDEDDFEDDDGDVEVNDDDDEVGSVRGGRGTRSGGNEYYGSDDENQHDYNLKSIKDSHKRILKVDGRENTAEKSVVFDNLTQLKQHLEKQLARELPVKPDDSDPAEPNDYRKLFRRRDDIIRLLHEPFFDQLIIGCYIRFLIGVVDSVQVYRMCEVVGVDRTKKSYKLPATNNGTNMETNVRLHLNNAGEIKQYQKLEKISNHSLQDKEIEFHIHGMKSHPERDEVTKRTIRLIRNRHKSYAEYAYSHNDISNMVANKQGFNKLITTEYTTAMALLKKRLMEAEEKNDKELTETLKKEIKKLDDINEKHKENFQLFAKKQTDINRRMRESNVTRDMDAGMRKRYEEQEALAKGILPNAISDPFIRRETRPKILWNTSDALQKKKEESQKQNQQDKGKKTQSDEKIRGEQRKKNRGFEEDKWAISTQLTLFEVRKRIKQRLNVDPYENFKTSKKEKYLSKACGTLPPPGSKEREFLRGNNKSLRDYILLLNKNEEAQQE